MWVLINQSKISFQESLQICINAEQIVAQKDGGAADQPVDMRLSNMKPIGIKMGDRGFW